jgi:hypothetical protein
MSNANLERVLEEVKALTPDEQRQVKNLIDSLLNDSSSISPEDLLEQRLLEAGVISEIPKRIADSSFDDDFEPIEVKGKPMSETIIEERR